MTEHDDKGLYGKYIILKEEGEGTKVEVYYLDGEGAIYSTRRAVAKRTPCFVLSPEKRDDYGEASRVAMQAYAMMIRPRNPQLADDIEAWLVKTYANITDDEILKSHGVEIKEGGTLTTDEVEVDPDAPRLKVEVDLSGLKKVVDESKFIQPVECECGWKDHWSKTVTKKRHPGEFYCPKCDECVTNLCFPEDGRYEDGRA